MNSERFDGHKSALWQSTAVPAPATSPHPSSLKVDVAVVGGGFVGLNAGIDLLKAGFSVAVLEARELGFGASGRSGGQVNLGLNLGPSRLIELYGEAQGRRTIELVRETPDRVFQRIERLGLHCDADRTGWVQAARDQQVLNGQAHLAEDYARYGGGMDVLNAKQLADLTGTNAYVGGLHCPSAGTLQPLSYTRELARVFMDKGGCLFENAPVTKLSVTKLSKNKLQVGNWMCEAKYTCLCTNAYTDMDTPALMPGLRQRVVPIRSLLVATEPLSADLRESILPNRLSFVDKRKLILYMRYDRDGRLCIGDHGPMRDAFQLSDFEGVKARARAVFPALEKVGFDYHWGGRVAMTRDTLPFIWEASPNTFAAMGCNGRGVGMGTMMGQTLAKAIVVRSKGADLQAAATLDMPLSQPKAYPFHRFHALGATLAIKRASWLDSRAGQT